jgi:hypothetical protein
MIRGSRSGCASAIAKAGTPRTMTDNGAALVTGGSRGIGAATAQALGRVGYAVVEDDRRRLTAELEADPLDVFGALGHDQPPGGRAAGKGNLVDGRVRDEAAPGLPVTGDDAQHPVREACLLADLGQDGKAERGLRRRLAHEGAPRRQGGRELHGGKHDRAVPRDDAGDDPDGLLEDRGPDAHAVARLGELVPFGEVGMDAQVRDRA